MKQNSNFSSYYAALFAMGLVAVATGLDLSGRLFTSLYDDWHYICVGLVAVLYFGITVFSEWVSTEKRKRHVKVLEDKLAHVEWRFDGIKDSNAAMRHEVEFMRKSQEEHWRLCSKTIDKIDDLLKLKASIAVVPPQPQYQAEKSVHDAIEEVVGGRT